MAHYSTMTFRSVSTERHPTPQHSKTHHVKYLDVSLERQTGRTNCLINPGNVLAGGSFIVGVRAVGLPSFSDGIGLSYYYYYYL